MTGLLPYPSSRASRLLGYEIAGAVAVTIAVALVWARQHPRPVFWPEWVIYGLLVALLLQVSLWFAWQMTPGPARRFGVHLALVAVSVVVDLGAWVLSGRGFFWPIFTWPVFGLSLVLHAMVWQRMTPEREREWAARLEDLRRTRRGALDSQAAELQRIERNLHDGAQARLVSLGMNLSLARQLMDTDPEQAAALIDESRDTALVALEDVRDVVTSIYPSVLAERGLAGAIEVVALDLSVPARFSSNVGGRLRPAVESAAYFAVAECLANAVKHSHADHIEVEVHHAGTVLHLCVRDNGVGGARRGGGSGLDGVAQRLESLDGGLTVISPDGGPTTIEMEIPCELSSSKT